MEILHIDGRGSRKGQSLVELLVGVTLGTFIIGSAVGALILTLNINMQSRASEAASALAAEMTDNVRSTAEGGWFKVYGVAAKGAGNHYHLVNPKTLTGTIAVTNGSTAVTGTGTLFQDELAAGDYMTIEGRTVRVQSVTSQLALVLESAYAGTTASGLAAYREFSVRSGDEAPIALGNVTFTRYFTIENVRRTACGRADITENALTACTDNGADVLEDPLTQKVVVTVSWPGREGDITNMQATEYLSRSKSMTTHYTDWQGGLRVPATGVVTQPDNLYVEINALSGTSTPGALMLENPSGGPPAGANISSVNRWAWNDVRGWIDVYETGNVQVTDTEIRGYAAFDGTTDYIAFDCATSPTGNVCAGGAGNWGVVNDGSGGLFGYAWNDGIGWISFNCDQTGVGGGNNCASGGGVDYGVTINPSTGDFSGWAWNDIAGWISFNSSNCDLNGNGFLDVACGGNDTSTPVVSYKVNTDWRASVGVTGYLTSSTFDTASERGATFSSIMWRGSLGMGSSGVRFQFASGDSAAGPWNYIGPDGTSATYYQPTGPGIPLPLVAASHNNDRYFRYRIYVSRDYSATSPTVEDVVVTWYR